MHFLLSRYLRNVLVAMALVALRSLLRTTAIPARPSWVSLSGVQAGHLLQRSVRRSGCKARAEVRAEVHTFVLMGLGELQEAII